MVLATQELPEMVRSEEEGASVDYGQPLSDWTPLLSLPGRRSDNRHVILCLDGWQQSS